jgi:hypothetical protein
MRVATGVRLFLSLVVAVVVLALLALRAQLP